MSSDAVTWEGADVLRGSLAPIESLDPWPGNPRRGDVAAIAGSLQRFGQVKPVVVQGSRIVAGHHVVAAAREVGWTHVAVLDHAFASADEARAFLLADNRVAELGGVDLTDLTEHLAYLADLDMLTGTGYTADDLDGYLAELAKLQDGVGDLVDVSFKARNPADVRELVLMFSPAQFEQVETWLGIVRKETGVEGASEAVYEALRLAATQLNG